MTGRLERSSIDFYLLWERVSAFVTEMGIDGDKKHIATKGYIQLPILVVLFTKARPPAYGKTLIV